MKYEIIERGGFKYFEAGEGEPLILLHGLINALSNWERVIDHFKNNYRVLIPVLFQY